ncbi:MAG: hypothetical protein WC802_03345 [Patescibacteria group bacterium]|jgi:hypothetical protein
MKPARKKDLPVPVPGDEERHDQKEMWGRRLRRINKRLAEFGLPLLHTLGNHLDGEDEVKAILGVHGYGESEDHPDPYFYIVTYLCIRHDGKEKTKEHTYAVLMNAKHTPLSTEMGSVAATGAVCITTYNDEWMVCIEQHRGPTCQDWTIEIPRGYVPEGGLVFGRLPIPNDFVAVDMDLNVIRTCDLPIGIVKNELGSLLARSVITPERLTLLSLPWENTGNSSNVTPIFHLGLRGDPEFVLKFPLYGKDEKWGRRVLGPPQQRLVFIPLRCMEDEYMRMGIGSLHCVAALNYYFTYVRVLRRVT